jgi:tetraacyldisaccharide 4'-kinase
MVDALGLRVLDEMVHPDHHCYTREDVDHLRAKAKAAKADLIVTTEKDAGKLAPLLNSGDNSWWALRLGTEITVGEPQLRQSIFQPASKTPMEVCA